VVHVAVLLTPDAPATRVGLHSVVLPYINATGPSGGAKLPVSVAVKVTGWPCGDVAGEPVTDALVVSGLTVIVTGDDGDDAWVASPR
jgi:hypothetical protein